jgi:hypothetical protein
MPDTPSFAPWAKGGTVLTFPFGQISPHRNGQCTRSRKNWSHGQSNLASCCAMLRMEIFQMTRATSPVGSRFASLPLALGHPRNFSPTGLRSPAPDGAGRRRVTNHHSRVTNHCLSNRNKVRIEIGVTYSKQTRGTNSNRNSFRG